MNAQVISIRRRRLRLSAIHNAISRAGDSSGFTLIEMVLALTIFALLAGIIYGAFSLSQRAVAKAQASAEHNQVQRATVDLLGSYIRSAFPFRPTPQDQTIFFDGASDSLTFISAYSHALGGRGLAKIRISAEQADDGRATLSIEEATPVRLNGDEGSAGYSQNLVVRERIKNFRLSYMDPQAEEEIWEERWNGPERRLLPRAVRLTYEGESGGEVRWIFPVMLMVLAP